MFLFRKKKSDIILYAYDGLRPWGRSVVKAARRLGIESRLFRESRDVPDKKSVFVFFDMMAQYRDDERKRLVSISADLAEKKNIFVVPKAHERAYQFDKSLQAKLFSDWVPRTWYADSPAEARRAISEIKFPLMSKSKLSIQSKNVRVIKNRESAEKEIHLAFAGDGIPCSDGALQKGYLLWQEFVKGDGFDWRIGIVAKKYAYIVKRFNRGNIPLASGSGFLEPVTELNDDSKSLLDYVLAFAGKNDLTLAGVDVIDGAGGRRYVLESHCSWGIGLKSQKSRIFERVNGGWIPTKHTNSRIHHVVAKAIADGDFS